MDKNAIDAARLALTRAESALQTMQEADTLAKMNDAWSHFLLMANRVYVKLEQGAKSNGTSRAWFGRKKHERRTDPLLKYIKNARDVDEHGLAPVTASRFIGVVLFDYVLAAETEVQLVDVVNRQVRYGPPPGDTDPVSVARKAVDHLKCLVQEAEQLQTPPP